MVTFSPSKSGSSSKSVIAETVPISKLEYWQSVMDSRWNFSPKYFPEKEWPSGKPIRPNFLISFLFYQGKDQKYHHEARCAWLPVRSFHLAKYCQGLHSPPRAR